MLMTTHESKHFDAVHVACSGRAPSTERSTTVLDGFEAVTGFEEFGTLEDCNDVRTICEWSPSRPRSGFVVLYRRSRPQAVSETQQ
jgi:hypothetical protein